MTDYVTAPYMENGVIKRKEGFKFVSKSICLNNGFFIEDKNGTGRLSAIQFENPDILKIGDFIEFENIFNSSGYWNVLNGDIWVNGYKIEKKSLYDIYYGGIKKII